MQKPVELELNTNLSVIELFFHNYIWFIIFLFGFLTFGIINVSMILYNGGVIGFLIGYSLKTNQFMQLMLWLAPHGVFEISALIISNSFAFFVIYLFYSKVIREINIKSNIKNLFTNSFFLITILSLIAAFLEVYINYK
ncbi:stage II sporulation protein M [Staphylococcus cornubiensis]|uniref:stage II sporulation protein M n=1 Tax=Staphylococcus cornubiensis TaxID=1986155 RepID=UPI003B82E446